MPTTAPTTDVPRPGDVVVAETATSLIKAGQRGVIDGGNHYGDDLLMVVFAPSAHRRRPTADDPHPDYVSVSGGPCPPIRPDELTFVGTTEQRFWCWKDLPRAGGGIDYTDTVNLWSWTPADTRI